MTVQDVIQRALTINTRLGAGRTAGPAESTVCLGVLNAMLSNWATDKLNVFTIQFAIYPLTANKQQYTIGPHPSTGTDPDFVAPRPVMIEHAALVATTEGADADFLLELIPEAGWAPLRAKADKSTLPSKLYNDYAAPASTLYLYPIPSTASHLKLYTWVVIGGYTALTDVADFAAGYERAVILGLAIETAPLFNMPVTPVMAAEAAEAIQNVKKLNAARLGIAG